MSSLAVALIQRCQYSRCKYTCGFVLDDDAFISQESSLLINPLDELLVRLSRVSFERVSPLRSSSFKLFVPLGFLEGSRFLISTSVSKTSCVIASWDLERSSNLLHWPSIGFFCLHVSLLVCLSFKTLFEVDSLAVSKEVGSSVSLSLGALCCSSCASFSPLHAASSVCPPTSRQRCAWLFARHGRSLEGGGSVWFCFLSFSSFPQTCF